jgi:hypothetical protein
LQNSSVESRNFFAKVDGKKVEMRLVLRLVDGLAEGDGSKGSNLFIRAGVA